MSRWAQGKPSTNSRRNQPAVMLPAGRPPVFFTSAMSDLISSRYSSQSGSGQTRSPARSPACADLLDQRVVGAHDAGRGVPERDDDGAGERGDVEHAGGLVAARVGERVAEDEPALGVGVDDLDRLAEWLVITSPGLNAVPDGMFSVLGIRPTTWTFGRSRPSTSKVPSTAAAPDMSYFMSSMFCAGLIEMPPVSKVTPFPTSTTGAPSAPVYSSTMNRGSSALPCATASRPPIFSASIARLVEHGDARSRAAAPVLGATSAEVGRRADVARQHLDARARSLPGADRGADARGRGRPRRVVGGQHVDALERRLSALPAAASSRRTARRPGPGLRRSPGPASAGVDARRGPRGAGGTPRAARRAPRARLAAIAAARRSAAAVDLLRLAQAHQQHPRARARRVEQRRLVPLAGEIAGREAAGRARRRRRASSVGERRRQRRRAAPRRASSGVAWPAGAAWTTAVSNGIGASVC